MYFTLNFLAHYRLGMLNVTNLLMCDGLLSWSWALEIMCVFKVTGHYNVRWACLVFSLYRKRGETVSCTC